MAPSAMPQYDLMYAATLVTVNFQAPEFYARHGWEEFGRIPTIPGVERIFMRKTLAG